jgi:hypothetical protein
MIAVSDAFKAAVKASTRQQHAYMSDGIVTYTDTDELRSMRITTNADVGRAVMRQAEVKAAPPPQSRVVPLFHGAVQRAAIDLGERKQGAASPDA